MLAGQKGYGANGLQNVLFPFDEMYITNGEQTSSGSHIGMYAIDFVGWDPQTGQSGNYRYPYYAPCDVVCVAKAYNTMVCWQSITNVNRIDGTVGITTFGFGHDNNYPDFTVGEIRLQGQLIGHTGTRVDVGDHCHMETVKGAYANFEVVPATGYMKMVNSVSIYDVCGVNDTIIYRGLGYNWRSFSTNTPTPTPTEVVPPSKFPWVLYARKLRNKRQNY